jgi:hypothetical protein
MIIRSNEERDGPEAGLPGVYKLASLNRESSNQLFETLEEWNDYLER